MHRFTYSYFQAESAKKANVRETTPAPRAEPEKDVPLKTPEDQKVDTKNKHKDGKSKEHKKQKRRSLSFLKKNKEKKEKEQKRATCNMHRVVT